MISTDIFFVFVSQSVASQHSVERKKAVVELKKTSPKLEVYEEGIVCFVIANQPTKSKMDKTNIDAYVDRKKAKEQNKMPN